MNKFDKTFPFAGVKSEFFKPFISRHFQTTIFISYKTAINNGYVVMTYVSVSLGFGHAVLIVGYNTNTNNYIYKSPETGRTHEAPVNAFDSDNNLVITANK